MTTAATHTAWRFLPNTLGPVYVAHVGNGHKRGDRYSYTSDAQQAAKLTEQQCRNFCAYMRECSSVGYWA